jgi:hypothetical protein
MPELLSHQFLLYISYMNFNRKLNALLLMKYSSSKTFQQRRRNTSLQQLYDIGNSVGMRVVGRVITPTQ